MVKPNRKYFYYNVVVKRSVIKDNINSLTSELYKNHINDFFTIGGNLSVLRREIEAILLYFSKILDRSSDVNPTERSSKNMQKHGSFEALQKEIESIRSDLMHPELLDEDEIGFLS
jgi:hypothetical protein